MKVTFYRIEALGSTYGFLEITETFKAYIDFIYTSTSRYRMLKKKIFFFKFLVKVMR